MVLSSQVEARHVYVSEAVCMCAWKHCGKTLLTEPAHLSAFAGQAGLFVWTRCVSLPLRRACVRLRVCGCARPEVFRTESAHTQVKPEGSQEDVRTGLWPPTVVRASTSAVFIPSSLLPQHHPPFQRVRTHTVSLYQPRLSDSKNTSVLTAPRSKSTTRILKLHSSLSFFKPAINAYIQNVKCEYEYE